MSGSQLRVSPLRQSDDERVAALFAAIAADSSAGHFHPHAFDPATAARICNYAGRDLYLGAFVGERLVGYGMLRGWDEGYDIPSLGIYLAREFRGSGVAARFMTSLHDFARERGARRVMLKVHPDNLSAVRLYNRVGYVFGGESARQIVGYVDL